MVPKILWYSVVEGVWEGSLTLLGGLRGKGTSFQMQGTGAWPGPADLA